MKSLKDMSEPELARYFSELARATESVLPTGPSKNGRALFALLVFDDPGLARYVSNANRADMIKALRETADLLDRNEDIQRDDPAGGGAR